MRQLKRQKYDDGTRAVIINCDHGDEIVIKYQGSRVAFIAVYHKASGAYYSYTHEDRYVQVATTIKNPSRQLKRAALRRIYECLQHCKNKL